MSKLARNSAKIDNAKDFLNKRNIDFEVCNKNYHFMIHVKGERVIDFWPTTGRWSNRLRETKGIGYEMLTEHLEREYGL